MLSFYSSAVKKVANFLSVFYDELSCKLFNLVLLFFRRERQKNQKAPLLLFENHFAKRHLDNEMRLFKQSTVVHKPILCWPNVCWPNACQPNAYQPNVYWSNVCQPNACQPNANWSNVCQPNVCWLNACQPNCIKPNACQPNACQPNACQPNIFRQKDVERSRKCLRFCVRICLYVSALEAQSEWWIRGAATIRQLDFSSNGKKWFLLKP